jgi:hypothetical protein
VISVPQKQIKDNYIKYLKEICMVMTDSMNFSSLMGITRDQPLYRRSVLSAAMRISFFFALRLRRRCKGYHGMGVQNDPVNLNDPKGLESYPFSSYFQGYTQADFEGLAVSQQLQDEDNAITLDLSLEHKQALGIGISSGVAAGFAAKNPVAGLIYGGIITAGQCTVCHWMRYMGKTYVKNHSPKLPELLVPTPPPNLDDRLKDNNCR